MQLQSLGGAQTVTGSMHWLSCGLLIDCGLFQGEYESRNAEPFPFDTSEIVAVILTHAHLDHVGRLPLLVKRGYHGPIYCTLPTAQLAEIVLKDAAHLQEEQYLRDLKLSRQQLKDPPEPPLYDADDVLATLDLFQPVMEYEQTMLLAGVRVTPYRAGHILGSVYLVIESTDKRILMSGDLGRDSMASLQRGIQPPPHVDALIIEATYAGKYHPAWEEVRTQLIEAIHWGVRQNGKILIPTFAIERAQWLIYTLGSLMKEGLIPRIPIFLDSPMAIRAMPFYQDSTELRADISERQQTGAHPFQPKELHFVHTRAESQRLGRYDAPAIILAGNGMMNGGRIEAHLKEYLPKENTTLLVASYQSPESTAGQILAGASRVKVMDAEIDVRARVFHIKGCSAHADESELMRFITQTRSSTVWLVHGDSLGMSAFANELQAQGIQAQSLPYGKTVTL